MSKSIYQFNTFDRFKNVITGVSTRVFGTMVSDGSINFKNISGFIEHYDIAISQAVFMKQIHSGKVSCVDDSKIKIINNRDGLLSKSKNIFLFVTTADCVPIVFYDPKAQIAGICHAGYKGILKGIIDNVINEFIKIGSQTDEIYVGIGPSIGGCCYDVGPERIAAFKKIFKDYKNLYTIKESKYYLDLKSVVLQKLLNIGLRQSHIELMDKCTKCNIHDYFSYRGDNKDTFGEFITFIGMKDI